jgi:hypothetical protein
MNWVEVIFASAILVLAFFSSQTEENRPYRVDVCLVASGLNGEDMSTNIWSDQIDAYFKRYPGSYCGRCGSERKCPK